MNEHDEARVYGSYVAFMMDTHKQEGMPGVLAFLDDMDEFTKTMIVAHMIQSLASH